METLIVNTLKVWREAERLLQTLPPVDPDHETVRQIVISMRDMYAGLSQARDMSIDTLASRRSQVDAAWEVLRRVQKGSVTELS